MGKFFLDLEFTNGNYYLSDIIELALIAEETGKVFHRYVKIHYRIPNRVQELTRITDKTLANLGCSFKDVMTEMIGFIQCEQLDSNTNPIILAHGGYYNDFPILLANCTKHSFTDYGILKNCLFVDSIDLFKDVGYEKSSLNNLCHEFKIKRDFHSALEDALILKRILCDKKSELCDHMYSYTFKDIGVWLNQKLPIPIKKIYDLERECSYPSDLRTLLYQRLTDMFFCK